MSKSNNTQLELNLCLEDEDSGHKNKAVNNNRLPYNWEIKRLDNFVKFTTGKLNANAANENGKYPFFTCSQETFRIDNYAFDTEAILLSGNNARGIYSVKYYKGKFNAYQRTYVITIKDKNVVSYNFLLHSLTISLERLRTLSIGTSTKYLTLGALKDFEIILPPLEEQKKIACILTLIQEAIQQQENAIALTTELKKALMQKLFTEGINNKPQKMTDIGLIPESWEVVNLGKLAKLKSGGTPSRQKPEYWENGSIPWVKTTEINYEYITKTEEYITEKGLANSSATMFSKGTLLMAMYGQGVTRGRVGILNIEASTNQACVAIMPNSEEELSTQFLYHYFSYHYEKLRNQGHGANQSNLSSTILKLFPISFPNIKEQLNISDYFDKLNFKLKQHQKKVTILQDLFRTLLHQLMTAQIRVDELDLSALLPPNLAPESPKWG